MRFPYNKKLVTLIRILKDKRDLPGGYAQYDGEVKKWTFKQTDVTTYYLTLIAVRYDFKFVAKINYFTWKLSCSDRESITFDNFRF